MRLHTHNEQQIVTQTEEVLLEDRLPIAEITKYLKSIICNLKALKYDIEEVFDPEEAFEILNEDLPDSPIEGVKEVFIQDIIRLGTVFFKMSKHSRMKLQILPVNSNMCRLFHEDYYRQRLLCTYLGPGTEWLDHDNVNRSGLGRGRNGNIVKDESKINRAKTFDVLLLKGARYEHGLGVVHRSPPVETSGQIRVLLKIDE